MTTEEKITTLNTLLGIENEDELLSTYLNLAKQEILSWRYGYSQNAPTDIPQDLEAIQIHAVVAGFNLSGAENQLVHSENGISRNFKYSDMVNYIHNNVIHIAGVVV